MSKNIYYFESLDSTNTTAKRMAAEGARHGTAVVADRQDGGRGRMGRRFFSPLGGLYMSVILRSGTELVTAFASVCVCEAVERLCGISVRVKWVNDILLDGRKVGGILAEAAGEAVVVGIGINFTTRIEDFPEDVRSTAGSLYSGGNAPVSRDKLAEEIVSRLVLPENRPSNAEIIAKYKGRMDMLGGKIMVHDHSGIYEAAALDVDEAGRLVVLTGGGERKVLSVGDVTVRC